MGSVEGRGKGVPLPFIKIYERERDTLTPTSVVYHCGETHFG
jgi:hypothetical protein